MITTLPLSVFSAKVLAHRYPTDEGQPIKLRRNDPILDLIRTSRRPSVSKREDQLLRAELELDLPLTRQLNMHTKRMIGMIIHNYHMDRLVAYLDGVREASEAPYRYIKIYCSKFGIDADDVDYDTLYKTYQRRRDTDGNNKAVNVLSDSDKNQATGELDAMAAIYYVMTDYLIGARGGLNAWVARAVKIYVDVKIHGMSIAQAMRAHDVGKSTVYHTIASMPRRIHHAARGLGLS